MLARQRPVVGSIPDSGNVTISYKSLLTGCAAPGGPGGD